MYRLSPVCLLQVEEAGRLAEDSPFEAVVFTGRSRGRGPSEAEQMRAAWQGPDVELVVEPEASTTAENAARTLPLLVERGIEHAVVVCALLHVFRTRFFFSRLYGPRGIETELHPVRAGRGFRALAWEVGATPFCRWQLRAAEAELERMTRS